MQSQAALGEEEAQATNDEADVVSPKTCLGTFSNEGEERDGCAENNVERDERVPPGQ